MKASTGNAYTITVTNIGAADTDGTKTIQVDDTISPATPAFTFETVTAGPWTCVAAPVPGVFARCTANAGTVITKNGGTSTFTFTVTAPNATGNFTKVTQRLPVKILLDHGQNTSHRLRPGLSVVATIRTRDGAQH